jgi:uncharacterized membrane protein
MKTALLFSDNATIKKLFSLTLEKIGIELIEGDIDNPQQEADIIFIDNSIYFDELIQKLPISAKKILILGKNEEKRPNFDEYMNKPFLPTDLIDLVNKIKEQSKEENIPENNEDLTLDDELSSNSDDDILSDDFNLDDDLEIDDFGDDLNFDDNDEEELLTDDIDLDDLDFDEETPEDNHDDIAIDDNELDLNENNFQEKFNNDSDISLDDLDFNDEISEDEDNIEETKENNMDLNKLDKELNDIDEKSVAEAIGESIDDDNEETNHLSDITNEEIESIPEEKINEDIEELPELEENKKIETSTSNNAEATINSLLNLNLEALKNSGATLTITIKFDKE